MRTDDRGPHSDPGRQWNPETDDERQVRELLQGAGPREPMPEEDRIAIEAAARSAWREMVGEGEPRTSRRPRRYGVWALAASILLVVATATWFLANLAPTSGATIATVEYFGAPLSVDGKPLRVGDPIAAGTTLATRGGNGYAPSLTLKLSDGQSLRLDAASRVTLESATRIELQQGAVYVDSGPSVREDASVEIVTSLGVVRDIGTQFEVRLDGALEEMSVRVREGRILLRLNGDTHSADAGEELVVAADHAVERSSVPISGPEWEWVVAAAPTIDIEGRSLGEFLDWVSRETGWRVRYLDPGLEASARAIELHGVIDGLRPDEALGVILEGSGLAYTADDGAVVIARP